MKKFFSFPIFLLVLGFYFHSVSADEGRDILDEILELNMESERESFESCSKYFLDSQKDTQSFATTSNEAVTVVDSDSSKSPSFPESKSLLNVCSKFQNSMPEEEKVHLHRRLHDLMKKARKLSHDSISWEKVIKPAFPNLQLSHRNPRFWEPSDVKQV